MMDSIWHYGVKGMKWGVRRDQAVLDRLAGRKTRSAASDRKQRRSENKQARKDWKSFKSSTTRKERSSLKIEAIRTRAQYIVDDVVKNKNERLVAVRNPHTGAGKLTTGKAFVDHLQAGGSFDVLNTDLYTYTPDSKD